MSLKTTYVGNKLEIYFEGELAFNKISHIEIVATPIDTDGWRRSSTKMLLNADPIPNYPPENALAALSEFYGLSIDEIQERLA